MDKNLVIIYNLFLNKSKISINNLIDLGINKENIDLFVMLEIVNKDDNYLYLKDYNGFFNYGLFLFNQRDYSSALKCFLICHNNYADIYTTVKLLECYLLLGEYDYALKTLNILKKIDSDVDNQQDYNYYLLLVSYLTSLNDENKETIKKMNFSDIRINNQKRYFDISAYNGVRRKALKRRFEDAKADLKNIVNNHKRVKTTDDLIQEQLLYDVVYGELFKYRIINALLIDKNYLEISYYLNEIANNRILSKYEETFLQLCNNYLSIKDGNNIELNDQKGSNLIDAIRNNNYRYALECIDYCDEINSHEKDVNIIKIMLNDIITLIDNKPKSLSKTKK